MNLTKQQAIVFRNIALILITAFAVGFAMSQTSRFDFEPYQSKMMIDEALLQTALDWAESTVHIVRIDQQVTGLVPLGEWLDIYGVGYNSADGNPGQPVFVLAMKGDFRWGGLLPGQDASILPSTDAFTIGINAITGEPVSYIGRFQDPSFVVELPITFMPPITVTPEPESTGEVTPVMVVTSAPNAASNEIVPLPAAP